MSQGRKTTAAMVASIRRLTDAGVSVRAIAKELRVSVGTVMRHKQRHTAPHTHADGQ